MTSSFEKFRAQYPEGCLSADLVSMHDGQFIVRAVASNNGIPLATGLAASVDVQIAEDQARERAIALLGIQVDSQISAPKAALTDISPNTLSDTYTLADTSSADTSGANGHLSKPPEPAESSTAQAMPEPIDRDDSEEDAVTLEPPEAELDPSDDSGPPLEAIAEEPLKPSAATIALESFNTNPNPVDLSDVIAQTDVELTRLGWTNVQGREYLETTYGKRSRQQLTDEELMSFLLYLEEQP